jgi:predicted esterase
MAKKSGKMSGQPSFWSRLDGNLLELLDSFAGVLDIGSGDLEPALGHEETEEHEAEVRRTRGRRGSCCRPHIERTEEVVDAGEDPDPDAHPCAEAEGDWQKELRYGSICEDLEPILKLAKARGKTVLCIWFHFLTGKGADFEVGLRAKIADQLPWVEWYFPDAPKRPVTVYDGRIESCWFDQLEIPVTECMHTPGLEVSVSMVHALIRQAEAHGFPSNRILLGGMSQGGVLAMKAGYSYEKPIAGIIAASAWVPPCLSTAMRQPSTPLMYVIGDKDDVIPSTIFQKGAKKLAQEGCNQITTKVYPGLDHQWKFFQNKDAKQFIESVASNTQLSASRQPTAKIAKMRSPGA